MRPLAGLARPQFGYPGSGDPPADPPPVGTPPQPGDPNGPRNTGFPPGGSGEHHFGGGGGGSPFRSPGPGLDPDEAARQDAAARTPRPAYLQSLATRALRQAGYGSEEGNQLIRLARHGQLGTLQGPGGAYHDPYSSGLYGGAQNTFDPTPAPPNSSRDPLVGDEQKLTPADPRYYGGFRGGVQQGLEAVAQRGDARRARRQARRGA